MYTNQKKKKKNVLVKFVVRDVNEGANDKHHFVSFHFILSQMKNDKVNLFYICW